MVTCFKDHKILSFYHIFNRSIHNLKKGVSVINWVVSGRSSIECSKIMFRSVLFLLIRCTYYNLLGFTRIDDMSSKFNYFGKPCAYIFPFQISTSLCLQQDIYVIEARVIEGYGVRWTADGKQFRGFLEPQMLDGHDVGWRHWIDQIQKLIRRLNMQHQQYTERLYQFKCVITSVNWHCVSII